MSTEAKVKVKEKNCYDFAIEEFQKEIQKIRKTKKMDSMTLFRWRIFPAFEPKPVAESKRLEDIIGCLKLMRYRRAKLEEVTVDIAKFEKSYCKLSEKEREVLEFANTLSVAHAPDEKIHLKPLQTLKEQIPSLPRARGQSSRAREMEESPSHSDEELHFLTEAERSCLSNIEYPVASPNEIEALCKLSSDYFKDSKNSVITTGDEQALLAREFRSRAMF
ncbi:MAG: hypothetical protein QM752_01305 [Gammaproteobacteria bacterium]